ncbi:MAG: hypothetical protein WBQ23_10200 [Bacteroidota bacterium]
MSNAQKYAVMAMVIWSLIFIGLLLIVLLPGVSEFANPERSFWRLLTASIILPGFVLNAWLGWRSKRGRKSGELDERDDAVSLRASQATLMVIAPIVFLTAILLYELYSSSGMVPTGWLYLLAYGTVTLVSLVHSIASLVVDLRGEAHG